MEQIEDVIINANILPEILYRHISGDRVRICEVDGIISLIPIDSPVQSETPISDDLLGILKGAGIKNTDDIKNMRLEL